MKIEDPEKLKAIVQGCVREERKCQKMIFEMYYGKMMSACLRYISDKDEAQDVLQDGFIKVFSNISKFDFNGSFEGWVRRIIVNTAIDYIRKKKKDIFQVTDHEFIMVNYSEEADKTDDENMYANLKKNEILDAIQQLSPAYKTVFNMYVIDGYTHQQIAELLNINIGTSKSNLAKARMNLQKILKEKLFKYNK
ncbi:MAG: RNA polymerase sigma factor [Bacteroidia bacterium]